MDTFWPKDATVILNIPIDVDMPDWLAWHFDSKGNFSVKSAYKLAVNIRDHQLGRDASSSGSTANGDEEFKWQKIWQLKFPNKVKMFV
jgi:hypothetical protein